MTEGKSLHTTTNLLKICSSSLETKVLMRPEVYNLNLVELRG